MDSWEEMSYNKYRKLTDRKRLLEELEKDEKILNDKKIDLWNNQSNLRK